MHSVRRQAHRAASSVGSNGGVNYNPFARTKSRSSQDIEAPVTRTRSEANVEPTIEEQRRLDSRSDQNEFSPRHASTMPSNTASPVSPTDGARGFNDLPAQSAAEDFAQAERGPSKDSGDASDGTIVATNGEGVRKRGGKISHFFRKDHEGGNAVLERVESEKLSLEERKRKAHKRKIPVGAQLRAVLFSWINILLVFVPIGFALYYSKKVGPVPIFIVNFIAIIPLAAVLSYATEELAIRVGETLGGLLNATFGNAVELIVSVQALIKNEITIVKTSLIGSMLSNLLLVLGMSFFLGGYNRLEQFFNVTVAQTAASMLALCIASLIIPTVFHNMLADDHGTDGDAVKNSELSRGTAVILLFVYGCYLFFQLKTHTAMYNAPSQKVPKRKSSKVDEGAANRGVAAIGAGTAAASGGIINGKPLLNNPEDEDDDEEEFETPSLSVIGAVITLAISTTLVAFCSEFMVSSIEGVTATGSISTTFVGLILLPIVGNAAEHATAVTVAMKDKMDLSIGVAVGSSMQIALLVLPLIVVLGWILGKECMTLYFDTFQIATLFVSVLLVNYLIGDGKSHWLEGILLMCSYLIIALAAWFYPNIQEDQC